MYNIIEDNVTILPGVTIGRSDLYIVKIKVIIMSNFLKKGVIVCTGAKILSKSGKPEKGEAGIIAANAVLLNSTGPGGNWEGTSKIDWCS